MLVLVLEVLEVALTVTLTARDEDLEMVSLTDAVEETVPILLRLNVNNLLGVREGMLVGERPRLDSDADMSILVLRD